METQCCSKCKGEDIKNGFLGAGVQMVRMFPEERRGASSPVSAEYCCHDCGYIVSLFVDQPKNVR
ncbi:acetyltransferase [Rummeliibacillus sp. BSL5]